MKQYFDVVFTLMNSREKPISRCVMVVKSYSAKSAEVVASQRIRRMVRDWVLYSVDSVTANG